MFFVFGNLTWENERAGENESVSDTERERAGETVKERKRDGYRINEQKVNRKYIIYLSKMNLPRFGVIHDRQTGTINDRLYNKTGLLRSFFHLRFTA